MAGVNYALWAIEYQPSNFLSFVANEQTRRQMATDRADGCLLLMPNTMTPDNADLCTLSPLSLIACVWQLVENAKQ